MQIIREASDLLPDMTPEEFSKLLVNFYSKKFGETPDSEYVLSLFLEGRLIIILDEEEVLYLLEHYSFCDQLLKRYLETFEFIPNLDYSLGNILYVANVFSDLDFSETRHATHTFLKSIYKESNKITHVCRSVVSKGGELHFVRVNRRRI